MNGVLAGIVAEVPFGIQAAVWVWILVGIVVVVGSGAENGLLDEGVDLICLGVGILVRVAVGHGFWAYMLLGVVFAFAEGVIEAEASVWA